MDFCTFFLQWAVRSFPAHFPLSARKKDLSAFIFRRQVFCCFSGFVLHRCAEKLPKKYALVLRFRVRYVGCRTAQEYRQRAPIGGSRSAGNVRVERAEPAGDNWLMANALRRKPLSRAKKAAPPCGDAAV